jgi:hypothetical protein
MHTFISKPTPPVTVYVILKNMLVKFLRTFGRGRPPTVFFCALKALLRIKPYIKIKKGQ